MIRGCALIYVYIVRSSVLSLNVPLLNVDRFQWCFFYNSSPSQDVYLHIFFTLVPEFSFYTTCTSRVHAYTDWTWREVHTCTTEHDEKYIRVRRNMTRSTYVYDGTWREVHTCTTEHDEKYIRVRRNMTRSTYVYDGTWREVHTCTTEHDEKYIRVRMNMTRSTYNNMTESNITYMYQRT
jgi:ribulose bisphosphate carboxylase small subunit